MHNFRPSKRFIILTQVLILLTPLHTESLYLHILTNYYHRSGHTAANTLLSHSTPIPPPPAISMPVYSLSSTLTTSLTTSQTTTEKHTSMNIVTFASPISVAPPKLYTISLYKNTLTKEAFFDSGTGILQLLSPHQMGLVNVLGKRSGYEEGYSKRDACQKEGFGWVRCCDEGNEFASCECDILPECSSYVKLRLISTHPAGDHDLCICEVVGVGKWDGANKRVIAVSSNAKERPKDEMNALYTSTLRKEGII